MLSGIYSFRKDSQSLAAKGDKLLKASGRGKNDKIDKHYISENLYIFDISSSLKKEPNILTVNSDESITWYLNIGCTETSNKVSTINFLKRNDWNTLPSLCGNWIAINWNEATSSLKIASDFLGSVWLYITRSKEGYAFSQNYSVIKEYVKDELRLDMDNAVLELVIGYVPDNSTLYKNISIIPPASLIELCEDGIQLLDEKLPTYGDKYFGLSQEEKFKLLDRYFEEIFHTSILPDLEDTCISLSGGLDSRYALALMDKYGYSCEAFTFGLEDSEEVNEARKIASHAGSLTTVFTFSKASWNTWCNDINRLGNTGQVQLAGWSDEWLSLLSHKHRFVLHGYLGDALSGKHLTRASKAGDSWLDSWVNWSLFDWASSPLLEDRSIVDVKDLVKKRMNIVSHGLDFASPHQLAMHLDFFGRQRRWVASQANMISDYLGSKTFFCNGNLLDFWVNIPFSDLENQRLYRDYAHSRFPKFFGKSSENLFKKLLVKARNRLKRFDRNYAPLISYPIDREKIILQNADNIIELAGASSRIFSELIDCQEIANTTKTCQEKQSISQDEAALIIRGVNLMFLARSNAGAL